MFHLFALTLISHLISTSLAITIPSTDLQIRAKKLACAPGTSCDSNGKPTSCSPGWAGFPSTCVSCSPNKFSVVSHIAAGITYTLCISSSDTHTRTIDPVTSEVTSCIPNYFIGVPPNDLQKINMCMISCSGGLSHDDTGLNCINCYVAPGSNNVACQGLKNLYVATGNTLH